MIIMDKILKLMKKSNRSCDSIFDIAYVIEQNIHKLDNTEKFKEPTFFEIININDYSIVFCCSFNSDNPCKKVLNIDKNDVFYISDYLDK